MDDTLIENTKNQEHSPLKTEGFPGQRIVVLPPSVIAQSHTYELLKGLFPTDVGFFPRAVNHERERVEGINGAIFLYCIKGEGWCHIADAFHRVESGDLLVIPPGTPHAYGAHETHPWTIYWLHATGEHLSAFLAEMGVTAKRPKLQLHVDERLLALWTELIDTLEEGYAAPQLLYGSQILAHLMGAFAWHRHKPGYRSTSSQQGIAHTIQYMEQHLDRQLHIKGLAALANLSISHYSSLFQRQTGYAPLEYFIRLKMHRACQLLDITDQSISEIAAQLGYHDPLYFSRVFKSINQCSPRDYRKFSKG